MDNVLALVFVSASGGRGGNIGEFDSRVSLVKTSVLLSVSFVKSWAIIAFFLLYYVELP